MTESEIKRLLTGSESIHLECKKAQGGLPKSIWETYSAFANTDGGVILLGVDEIKDVKDDERFLTTGVTDADRLIKEFWNTVNSSKVNANILMDNDVDIIKVDNKDIVAIHVPRAPYNFRSVYVNENPAKGTYKRNYEGDYHCTESEWKAMVRDSSDDGNDGRIVDCYTMDDIDMPTLHRYRTAFMLRNAGHVWEDIDDKARNPRIQQMFRMIGYGENIGSGFPSILKTWKDENWAKPELTERQDLNEVDLMLKVDKDLFMTDKSSDKPSDKLSAKQHSILSYIKDHPSATQQELAGNIESLSFASAKYQVNALCKAGFLKRIGSNKTGHWEVCVETGKLQK